jgi:hypothetical protein
MKMKLIPFLAASVFLLIFITTKSCKDKNDNPAPTDLCSDGKRNRTESGVDCGGECKECPLLAPVNSNYFFQFKLGDSIVSLENNFPFFVGNLTAFPPLGYKWGADLTYQGKVEDLAGKFISFKPNDMPHIEIMYFTDQNKILSTAYPPSQSGANCYIRSVTLVDTLVTGIANPTTNYLYSVKGDFNCRIANTSNSYTDTITYGKFSLRIAIQK